MPDVCWGREQGWWRLHTHRKIPGYSLWQFPIMIKPFFCQQMILYSLLQPISSLYVSMVPYPLLRPSNRRKYNFTIPQLVCVSRCLTPVWQRKNKFQLTKQQERVGDATVISPSNRVQGSVCALLWSRLSPPVSNEASERAVTGSLKALCLRGAPSVILASDQTGSVSPAGRTRCQADCQKDWMHQSLRPVIRSCYNDKRRLLLYVPTGLFMWCQIM